MSVAVSLITTLLLFCIQLLLTAKDKHSVKMTPYECGFLPNTKSSTAMSFQFLMVLIVFMVFDLEVIMLIYFLLSVSWVMMILLVFMVLGLWFEWKLNKTQWVC